MSDTPNSADGGISEFDEVVIRRCANARWLFNTSVVGGVPTSPPVAREAAGRWMVIAVVGEGLVISRNGVLISIPSSDVTRVSAYSADALMDHLQRMSGYDG